MDNRDLMQGMRQSVISGDRAEAERLARLALDLGLDPLDVLEDGFSPGIREVGELWNKGEYFLPELIAGAESMKAAMRVLQPEFSENRTGLASHEKVVIGTVEGDIHDIGKSLVASMLSAHGFEVIDLGADVKLERFIETAERENARFICLSALLTTTMTGQKRLLDMLHDRGLRGRFKVLVGGAPVNADWAAGIGADAYGENAMAAVQAAKSLV